jgi:hypothetical protein
VAVGRALSPLRGWTNNDLVLINVGRLLNRQRDGAGDRIRRDRELVSGVGEPALTSGSVMERRLRLCPASGAFRNAAMREVGHHGLAAPQKRRITL